MGVAMWLLLYVAAAVQLSFRVGAWEHPHKRRLNIVLLSVFPLALLGGAVLLIKDKVKQ